MAKKLSLHEDRLLPADPGVRAIARRLYSEVRDLPLISPHGHTEAEWFASNEPFSNAADLLLAPDHYLYRMLYSQGVPLDRLGVPSRNGGSKVKPRDAWRLFAKHFYLFRGTPSALWLNQAFVTLFGLDVVLDEETADHYFDVIGAKLKEEAFRPRALFHRFNLEVLATTESPCDTLKHHQALKGSGWRGRVITTYRPDPVVDPENEHFKVSLELFANLTNKDVFSWRGYLDAHRLRRRAFAELGATATDHGHLTAATADLSEAEAERLFRTVTSGTCTPAEAELFRAQMLTEMARMSLDDRLVMQIHPGSYRNHNKLVFGEYGSDKGADIPQPTDYVRALKPLLDRFGNEPRLSLILFTLDESAYARELAPLAGHYPILKLGPAWWFFDSPDGLRRFRELTTETAGFYNTVGFNDDTRAFLSIPARHDVSRRVDCSFLAKLVSEHRMDEDEARIVAIDIAYNLPKRAYKLDDGGNRLALTA